MVCLGSHEYNVGKILSIAWELYYYHSGEGIKFLSLFLCVYI
jgi:hypothetical protein